MAPRLSGQTSIFGVVFFVSKALLGTERQKKLKKFTIFTRKPRSHVRILIYRTWPVSDYISCTLLCWDCHAKVSTCSALNIYHCPIEPPPPPPQFTIYILRSALILINVGNSTFGPAIMAVRSSCSYCHVRVNKWCNPNINHSRIGHVLYLDMHVH